MRVPLGWLAEWIELPPRDELLEKLTYGGLEVEDVLELGPDLSGLCVGRVVECGPHPRADRLSLCRVELGDGEPVEIVCGAPNVAAGQKVAVAPPGSTLPDGTRVKKARLRGVASHGMILSERELGIGDDHEGILVLDPGAVPGAPLSGVLPGGDTVLDLEITPNRGDWASLLGVAREVRAHFGGAVTVPPCEVAEDGRDVGEDVRVGIDDTEGCYRYVGRVVRGVEIRESPEWLQRRLEAAGVRPIDVVVDVTNLVMLELGQPLHAFDLASLRGGEVRVRAARPGERLITLDGQTRALEPPDLVIADAERAIAIAGVMGGADTEVTPATRDVLLESAHFHPSRIRATARRLNLHTGASYRFERGIDPEGQQRAVDRAARLLSELAGGTVSAGVASATGSAFPRVEEVALDPAHPNRLLGTALSTEEVVALLGRLDVRAALDAEGALRCAVPSHRLDLAIPEDLIEEIARLYGYQRIETTLPAAPVVEVRRPERYRVEECARDALCAAGLIELRTFVGISRRDLDALRFERGDVRGEPLRLANPLVDEEAEIRTSLLPSLLGMTRRNLAHQVDTVRVFEVAPVHLRRGEGELPDERPAAAAVLARSDARALWGGQAPLFFEAKAAVEHLLRELGRSAAFHTGLGEPYLHPGAAADVRAGDARLGAVGELHPEVAAHFGIDAECAVFELDLSALVERGPGPRAFHDASRFPAVRRDVAVVLDTGVAAGEVIEAIQKTGGEELASVRLFDRYTGEGIPDGRVSLAFRLVFQRLDRTMTDTQATRATERVREMLVRRFGGELR